MTGTSGTSVDSGSEQTVVVLELPGRVEYVWPSSSSDMVAGRPASASRTWEAAGESCRGRMGHQTCLRYGSPPKAELAAFG